MAGSLVDLKTSVSQAAGAPPTPAATDAGGAPETSAPPSGDLGAGAGAPAVPVAPATPGHVLLQKARDTYNYNDDESRAIRLFADSKKILDDQIAVDSSYGERVLPSLVGKKGAALATGIIGLVDDIKIDQEMAAEAHLPDHQKMWTSAQAAKVGFFNSATFGQLSRIVGGAGQLIQGRPWQEVAEEQGEKFRLMQKAFPTAFQAGEVAGFLMPGSLVKAVFSKAAFLGARVAGAAAGAAAEATGVEGAVGSVLGRIMKNPAMLDRARAVVGDTARGVIEQGVGGAAGTGAVAGIQGYLGSGTQDFSFDRAREMAVDSAEGGLKVGALAALTGGGLRAGVMAAEKPITWVANKAAGVVGRTVEELSGAPVESIRVFNRFPKEVRAAAGTEYKAGQELVDFVMDPRKSKIVELHEADQMLPHLPDVSPKPLLDFMRSFQPDPKNLNPAMTEQLDRLRQMAEKLESRLPQKALAGESGIGAGQAVADEAAKVPAATMRQFVDELQDAADGHYERESSFYMARVKDAARIARLSIVDEAKASGGDVGNTYVELMKKGADKVKVLQFIRNELGSTTTQMQRNAERVSDKFFGKNKTFQGERLQDLDNAWGTNFSERLKYAQAAEDLGITNAHQSPSLSPMQTTGRSSLGINLGRVAGAAAGGAIGYLATGDERGGGERLSGAAIGGTMGAFAGGIASSPRMGSLVVGTSDNITGFMRRLVSDPRALHFVAGEAPLAGKLAGFRPAGAGEGANAIATKRLAIPYQVQRLAKEISTALVKDGPESAASVTRLIADTPFFAGVVHYIDLAQRKYGDRTVDRAVQILQNGGKQ